MPRFTIKDLLIATTLISVGAGMLSILFRESDYVANQLGRDAIFIPLVVWFVGGGLIGAGLFAPFKRPIIGLFVGLAIQFLLFVLFIVTSEQL